MTVIKETTIEDLDNVQKLWADGDVMRFVGFPDGLQRTSEEMKGKVIDETTKGYYLNDKVLRYSKVVVAI